MPKKTSYKSRGGNKDSAEKSSFNSPHGGSAPPAGNDPLANQQRDPKGRIGQFGETGTPNLMKK
jgi:hypothetical protein